MSEQKYKMLFRLSGSKIDILLRFWNDRKKNTCQQNIFLFVSFNRNNIYNLLSIKQHWQKLFNILLKREIRSERCTEATTSEPFVSHIW